MSSWNGNVHGCFFFRLLGCQVGLLDDIESDYLTKQLCVAIFCLGSWSPRECEIDHGFWTKLLWTTINSKPKIYRFQVYPNLTYFVHLHPIWKEYILKKIHLFPTHMGPVALKIVRLLAAFWRLRKDPNLKYISITSSPQYSTASN